MVGIITTACAVAAIAGGGWGFRGLIETGHFFWGENPRQALLKARNDELHRTNLDLHQTNVRLEERNTHLETQNARLEENNNQLCRTNARLAEINLELTERLKAAESERNAVIKSLSRILREKTEDMIPVDRMVAFFGDMPGHNLRTAFLDNIEYKYLSQPMVLPSGFTVNQNTVDLLYEKTPKPKCPWTDLPLGPKEKIQRNQQLTDFNNLLKSAGLYEQFFCYIESLDTQAPIVEPLPLYNNKNASAADEKSVSEQSSGLRQRQKGVRNA